MILEGEVHVRLAWDGRRVTGVAVRSSRPRIAAHIARGRRPAEAVDLLSRLHSICGAAQGSAAATAIDAATGRKAPPTVRAARSLATVLETLHEHCLRLGMDWPVSLGEPPLVDFVRTVRAVLAPVLAATLDRALERDSRAVDRDAVLRAFAAAREAAAPVLLGMPVEAWLAASDLRDLASWRETGAVAPARWFDRLERELPRLGTSQIALMDVASADALRRAMLPAWRADPGFAERPTWDGAPAETGSLARMQHHPLVAAVVASAGNGVAARLVARLTDLARLLDEGATPADGGLGECVDDDVGYGLAQTARGLLVHRARVDGDTVRDYAIAAPTDWNFAAAGPFAAAVAAIGGDDMQVVRQRATLVARALDPCVHCVIEVGHA